MTKYKKILLATDFSKNAEVAFEHALDLAGKYNARLYIMHVINIAPLAAYEPYMPVVDFREFSRSIEDRLQKEYLSRLPRSISAEAKVVSGYPAMELASFAEQEDIDLVVIGAHGATGLTYVVFGSVADRLVRKANCSVLVVRLPAGTEQPE